jgi:hypothetical protein
MQQYLSSDNFLSFCSSETDEALNKKSFSFLVFYVSHIDTFVYIMYHLSFIKAEIKISDAT